jgi:hypothetical protein
MTATVLPVGLSDPAFGEVAAMFDDYRGHYGHVSQPEQTRAWLADQVTQRRLTLAAARWAAWSC